MRLKQTREPGGGSSPRARTREWSWPPGSVDHRAEAYTNALQPTRHAFCAKIPTWMARAVGSGGPQDPTFWNDGHGRQPHNVDGRAYPRRHEPRECLGTRGARGLSGSGYPYRDAVLLCLTAS